MTQTDVGLIQHPALEHAGGSMNMHLGLGGGLDKVVALSFDMRGDIAASNSRFAIGTTALGGLPIGEQFKVLGRAGIWHALVSSTDDRGVVPTFELMGFYRTDDKPVDPQHPEHGASYGGVVFGIREDVDLVAYTTLFVGYAFLFVPGY